MQYTARPLTLTGTPLCYLPPYIRKGPSFSFLIYTIIGNNSNPAIHGVNKMLESSGEGSSETQTRAREVEKTPFLSCISEAPGPKFNTCSFWMVSVVTAELTFPFTNGSQLPEPAVTYRSSEKIFGLAYSICWTLHGVMSIPKCCENL